MAQFMKIQIRVILPGGENITIPLNEDENFELFQKRCLGMYNLQLEKEYFNFNESIIDKDENLYNFIKSLNAANNDTQTDVIIYEINLQNNSEDTSSVVKNEFDNTYVNQEENIDCIANKTFLSEVENIEPLLNLNNETELTENLFENVSYDLINQKNVIEEKNLVAENKNVSNIEIISDLITNDENKTSETSQIYDYMDIESKLREMHATSEEYVSDYCRLCAKVLKTEDKILIFGDDHIDEKIHFCLPINVGTEDGLPHQMCKECVEQLKCYSEFVQNVLEADKVLRLKFLNSEAVEPDATPIQDPVKFEVDETIDFLKLEGNPNAENLKCRFCETSLINADMSVQHSVEVHGNTTSLFICVICEQGFTSIKLLTDHVQSKHYEQFQSRLRKYQCSVCLRRYTSDNQLQGHTCLKGAMGQSLHCEICNQEFSSKQRLNFHRQFHLKNARPLFCSKCLLSFKDENEYFDHVNFMHDTQQVFVCDVCEKSFTLRSALNNHKKVHVGERNFRCETCNKCFLNRQMLEQHEVIHAETKPYQCHICGKKVNRLGRLKKHLLTHESDPIVNDVYICSICKECFCDAVEGDNHRLNCHSDVEDCLDIISTDRVFRCEFCERCYSTPEALNMHRGGHTGDNPYSCHVCNAKFPSYARCISHKTTHGIYKEGAEKVHFSVVKHFLCEHCSRSYLHWNYLKLHRQLKHSEDPKTYKCPECYMEFLNMWGLNYHRKTKHQKSPIKCPDCGKYLANMKNFQIHVTNQHSDNRTKEFKCDKCSKAFAYQVSLELHQKSHIKEHKCPRCPRTFLHSAGLTTHLKQHQDPNLVCSFCGKKFLTKNDWEQHEIIHKKKKFNCDICDKNFDTKNSLMEHNKVHTCRPYVCEVCGLAFRRPFTLRNHQNRHLKAKNSGSFVLMVDMKEEQQEAQKKQVNAAMTVIEENNTPQNSFIQLGLENAASENYIDIGNGNFLKVQGSTVNIDGKDYIVIDQNGKAVDKNQQFQMIVDENFEENQLGQQIVQSYDNTVMLVDGNNPIILNAENQNEPEYVFTTDNNITKDNTAYVIGNQFVLGSDDQVTF